MPGVNSFDFSKPILVLAPHLVLPPRNGADLLVERSARWLSMSTPEVRVVGAQETVVYRRALGESGGTGSGMRSRGTAAARTLTLRSHYYRERFLTSSFRNRARAAAEAGPWGGIICSYLTTAEVVEGTDVPVAIWTHNDEFQWFEDRTDATVNPVARRVASQSLTYLHRHGDELADGAVLMNVSEADEAGFRLNLGDHESIVVPIGTDIDVPVAGALEPTDEPAALLFVGSLSVQMNADALRHFATVFEPRLRATLPGTSLTVAGSNPSKTVRAMCSDHGWTLIGDPSDDQLDELYLESTFSILPFAYATGSKLKLLASLAHGVPFLATEAVDVDAELMVAPSVRSSDPQIWVGTLDAVASRGITKDEREKLRATTQQYSWEHSVRSMVNQLRSA